MPGDNFETIRPRNVVILVKAETTVATDAAPDATNAIPFEADGFSYNAPYRSEASNEANGSLVAAAPLIVGQPAEVSIRVRLKGAGPGTTYTSLVKPPHHTLLEACGKRGLFTAGVAAAAITAGSETTATLGTGFGSTAQSYRGMPLQLAAGNSGGRLVHVSGYDGSKVATLADIFAAALNTSVTAELPANWTYAGTSPKDVAARATDHPSATVYIYEDGTLHKFVGCRGSIQDMGGQIARPGFATFNLMGIYAGKSEASMPAVSVPQHAAPVLTMGSGGINPALVVNRKELKVSQWSLNEAQQKEVTDDPNTPFGFGSPELAGRQPRLQIDPLATLTSNRDTVAEIEAGSQYPSVIRFGSVAGNRWSLVNPLLQPADPAVAQRGIYRSENLSLAALNPGVDPAGRDAESILCFY
jgi:hypothetical protein